jgi:hypothetical protein
MSVFKIKLEDKAAFLNRLEKQGVGLDSTQIVDNKLEGYFEATIDEPKQLEVATSILKQSPKINTIKEMENKKKMTKDELKEMVRQELQAVLAEKKKVKDEEKKDKLDENEELNEDASQVVMDLLGQLAGLAGIGLTGVQILRWQDKLEKENPELHKQLGKVSGAIGAADPSKNLEEKEEKEEGYMGTQYDSSEDMAVDMIKKGIYEKLSPEMFERMDAVTSTRAQLAMIKAAEIMMNELTEEGFEVLDIREYFTQLIANDI